MFGSSQYVAIISKAETALRRVHWLFTHRALLKWVPIAWMTNHICFVNKHLFHSRPYIYLHRTVIVRLLVSLGRLSGPKPLAALFMEIQELRQNKRTWSSKKSTTYPLLIGQLGAVCKTLSNSLGNLGPRARFPDAECFRLSALPLVWLNCEEGKRA